MSVHRKISAIRDAALGLIRRAGIGLRQEEIDGMEVLDFGLGEPEISGAQIAHILDSERIAVRLIALLPNQTEPEHTHPASRNGGGKEETIRCHWGALYLYGPGEPTPDPAVLPPQHRSHTYTVHRQYILRPGEQATLQPGSPHWFTAGTEGAVVWSYSSRATDAKDVFTDPAVVR